MVFSSCREQVQINLAHKICGIQELELRKNKTKEVKAEIRKDRQELITDLRTYALQYNQPPYELEANLRGINIYFSRIFLNIPPRGA